MITPRYMPLRLFVIILRQHYGFDCRDFAAIDDDAMFDDA